MVSLSSNGHTQSSQSPNPNTTYTSATVEYAGTAGQTYIAYGTHSAQISPHYWGLVDDDYYGMDQWPGFDILNNWDFPFTAFSPDTDTNSPYIDLGETYDSASVDVPQNCGSGDQRTTMIQEYAQYQTPYYPQCSEFTQNIGDPNFTFSQLNSGSYSLAILRSYFLSDLDNLEGLTSFSINSGYRNPAKAGD